MQWQQLLFCIVFYQYWNALIRLWLFKKICNDILLLLCYTVINSEYIFILDEQVRLRMKLLTFVIVIDVIHQFNPSLVGWSWSRGSPIGDRNETHCAQGWNCAQLNVAQPGATCRYETELWLPVSLTVMSFTEPWARTVLNATPHGDTCRHKRHRGKTLYIYGPDAVNLSEMHGHKLWISSSLYLTHASVALL